MLLAQHFVCGSDCNVAYNLNWCRCCNFVSTFDFCWCVMLFSFLFYVCCCFDDAVHFLVAVTINIIVMLLFCHTPFMHHFWRFQQLLQLTQSASTWKADAPHTIGNHTQNKTQPRSHYNYRSALVHHYHYIE